MREDAERQFIQALHAMGVIMPRRYLEFSDFALPPLRGLLRAVTTDVDVFLIFLGGMALSALPRPLRGIGVALLTYVFIRRTDQIAAAYARKLDTLVAVTNRQNV